MVVSCRRCVCCRTVTVVRVVLGHGFNVFHDSTTWKLVMGLVCCGFRLTCFCGGFFVVVRSQGGLCIHGGSTLLRLNRVALDLVGFLLDLVWPRIGQFYLVGVDHN